MIAEPVEQNNTNTTQTMGAKLYRIYRRIRKLNNKFALIALLFAIMGNLASIPAHIESVRIFLIKRYQVEDAVFWHVLLGSLVCIVLIGSYLFLALWLYDGRVAAKPQRVRRFYGTLLLIGAIAVSAINIYFVIPRVPPIGPVVENIEGKMRKALLAQQIDEPLIKQGGEAGNDDSGGFQFAQNGGPHDAQVWTTAQVLYALEMGNPGKPEIRQAIRDGFAYIERMRITDVNGPCQANGQQDGWGYLKSLPWGVTEINSWVLLCENCVTAHNFGLSRLERV